MVRYEKYGTETRRTVPVKNRYTTRYEIYNFDGTTTGTTYHGWPTDTRADQRWLTHHPQALRKLTDALC